MEIPARARQEEGEEVGEIESDPFAEMDALLAGGVMYGREQYLDRVSCPFWVRITDQVADIFTKALDKTTFLRFRALLLNVASDAVTTYQRDLVYGQVQA